MPSSPPSPVSLTRRLGARLGALVLAVVGTLAAALVLGVGTASAGGPTSVLIVSPSTGVTASAYTDEEEYQQLMTALDPTPVAQDDAPDEIPGPGETQVTVTWLIHDVAVWRIDRIVVDASGGPWVSTQQSTGTSVDLDQPAVWHRAAEPRQLTDLLERWGMLDGSPRGDADPGLAAAGDDPARTDTADTAGTTDTTPRAVADDGTLAGWWVALPALGVGVLGGAFGPLVTRRVTGRWARRREKGAPQQLIDLERVPTSPSRPRS